MAKIISEYIGMIVSITKKDASEYEPENWRMDHIGIPGTVTVLESENQAPGKRFVYFCDVTGAYIRTGAGDILKNEKYILLTTSNSIYTFEIVARQE